MGRIVINKNNMEEEILELFCGLSDGTIDCEPEAKSRLLDILKKKIKEMDSLIGSKSSDYNKGVQDCVNLLSE